VPENGYPGEEERKIKGKSEKKNGKGKEPERIMSLCGFVELKRKIDACWRRREGSYGHAKLR